ncbi:MAG: S8 family peptidase, partial [Bacteroidales bacterium]|nr:S8 family peptidase [Bacteroidales bacterium]
HETMQSMRLFDNSELARTFLVEFDDTEKADELLAKLAAMPEVEMVEKVPTYFITGYMPETEMAADEPADEPAEASDETLNDPFYTSNFNWHLRLIHAEEAWKQQQGTANITVAVVDNAIWGEHPDLQIPSERQYNVRDGKVGNSAPPVSVNQNTQCPTWGSCDVYLWSHGTHCAGAIGAINNNGVGIASIGSGVSVMGVSCPSNTVGAVQNAFIGITYAAEHGARVISTSWGNYNIANTERAIVQACIDKGIVMVSAAGNDNYNRPFYPANLPGVISIGSVNSDKTVSSFSNYGEWVMLAAPGGYISANGREGQYCIFSTTYCQSQRYRINGVNGVKGEYYDGMHGTSMATPVTSGLCGLLLSADSTLTPYLLREILMASAQTIEGNTKPIQPGSGIIDAAAALEMVKNRKPMPRNLTASREKGSRTVSLSWQAPSEGKVKSYKIYVNGVKKTEVADTAWSEEVALSENLYHYGVAAEFEDGSVSLRACSDVYVPDLGEVNITVRPAGCGNVLPESGFYPQKDTLHLVAVPVNGCTFDRWMENGKRIGSDSLLNYTVSAGKSTIEAVFKGTPNVDVEETAPAGSLKIYPNPTRETLFVESNNEIYRAEVYSLSGMKLLELSSAAGAMQVELNVGRFADGMYLLKVFGKNGISIEKFLIKK